jgi:hypothetical protein
MPSGCNVCNSRDNWWSRDNFSNQIIGACYDPPWYSLKPQGRNLKCQIFKQHFFKIGLYWCLDPTKNRGWTKMATPRFACHSDANRSKPLWSVLLIMFYSFLCSVFSFFVFILCFLHRLLPVSLDCPFLIAPSVSSNVSQVAIAYIARWVWLASSPQCGIARVWSSVGLNQRLWNWYLLFLWTNSSVSLSGSTATPLSQFTQFFIAS